MIPHQMLFLLCACFTFLVVVQVATCCPYAIIEKPCVQCSKWKRDKESCKTLGTTCVWVERLSAKMKRMCKNNYGGIRQCREACKGDFGCHERQGLVGGCNFRCAGVCRLQEGCRWNDAAKSCEVKPTTTLRRLRPREDNPERRILCRRRRRALSSSGESSGKNNGGEETRERNLDPAEPICLQSGEFNQGCLIPCATGCCVCSCIRREVTCRPASECLSLEKSLPVFQESCQFPSFCVPA